jgi:hypothetical protein
MVVKMDSYLERARKSLPGTPSKSRGRPKKYLAGRLVLTTTYPADMQDILEVAKAYATSKKMSLGEYFLALAKNDLESKGLLEAPHAPATPEAVGEAETEVEWIKNKLINALGPEWWKIRVGYHKKVKEIYLKVKGTKIGEELKQVWNDLIDRTIPEDRPEREEWKIKD